MSIEEYHAVLNQSNINKNNNKFYKLDIVGSPPNYQVVAKYGRVGDSGTTHIKYNGPSLDDAILEFKKAFKSKSGNNWEDRANFVEKKGKYVLVDLETKDERIEATQRALDGAGVTVAACTLPKETQMLVDFLFDRDMLQSSMADLQIDLSRLPLGALSQRQVARGMATLEKLQEELYKARPSTKTLVELSNDFYTIIPHNFGRSRPPVIETQQRLQEKLDMLAVLGDITTAQEMSDTATSAKGPQAHPLDTKYSELNADLELVPDDSNEFKMILDYATNTGSKSFKVRRAWRVDRKGESERFSAHAELGNRTLLWHGTNIAVVAAIVKEGLRIMPHSRGRVGRGIYLASEQSKSAFYTRGACYQGQNMGVLFLVEAAMGKAHNVTKDDWGIKGPPPGFDSIIAQGRMEPSLRTMMTFDGVPVKIPGGCVAANPGFADSCFYQSEYLVYRESQLRVRYLVLFEIR